MRQPCLSRKHPKPGPRPIHGQWGGLRFLQTRRTTSQPFDQGEQALVFTGAMDYWPNIDGVSWFVADMLPRLLARPPRPALFISWAASPSPQVKALAGAPMWWSRAPCPMCGPTCSTPAPWWRRCVARGIQNKILEAMAMQQPVVTVSSCADAIGATAGQGLLRADKPEFVTALLELLQSPTDRAALGERARHYVEQECSWQAHLKIDHDLAARLRSQSPARKPTATATA